MKISAQYLSMVVSLGAVCAWAQPPTAPAAKAGKKDVGELSLEDLLDQSVEVTTKQARTTRQAPGVVLVLTREEILATGARDLMEVLQLVPGFSFHTDVEGVVGVGFRGLWGHEGKVLLLLDGIEQNELMYSTTQFGLHVLVHNLERIEVIRGPGSAVYGGTAELAVINVITRSGKDLMGGDLAGRFAQTTGAPGDYSGSISAGWASEEQKLDISGNVTLGQGRRTTRPWADFSGNTLNMKNELMGDFSATVGLKWHGLKARFLYDQYDGSATIGYGVVEPEATEHFRTFAADLQYDVQLSDTMVLRPHLSFRTNIPWEGTDKALDIFYTKSAERLLGGVSLQWDPIQDLSLLFGVEGFYDHAWLNDPELIGSQTDFQGAPTVSYVNGAAYAQALWDTPIVNIAVGGRFEYHSVIGPNFAPRVALTRQVDRVNFKLLYSGAFRSPSIENINLSTNLRPERVDIGEAEIGVTALDVFYASVNGFYMRLQQPIAYLYDEATQTEGYSNSAALSSAGAEVQLIARGRFGFASASYSLAIPTEYSSAGAEVYGVPGMPGRTLGFPHHKVTATGKLRAWRGLSLGGSLLYLSNRYAYTTPTDALDGSGVIGRVADTVTVGLWAEYQDLAVKGLSLQVGVSNLFDSNVELLQPYNGGLAPIPGRGRELFLRLAYAFSLSP